MKLLKRYLAINLALLMFITLLPVTVLASMIYSNYERKTFYPSGYEEYSFSYKELDKEENMVTFRVSTTYGNLKVYNSAGNELSVAEHKGLYSYIPYDYMEVTLPIRKYEEYKIVYQSEPTVRDVVKYASTAANCTVLEDDVEAEVRLHYYNGFEWEKGLFYRFTPTSSGQYEFTTSTSAEVSYYNADMERLGREIARNNSVKMSMEADQTYYISLYRLSDKIGREDIRSTIHLVDKTEHQHSYTERIVPATCLERGYTVRTCSCGYSYKDNYTNALGHDYYNGKCIRCGANDSRLFIDASHFPDANFRAYISARFDKDGDGILSASEIANVKSIACGKRNISSLAGIEYFPALTTLICNDNQISSLPTLPQGLTELFCHNNQLTSLPELPKNLNTLWCGGNMLTTLPALPSSIHYLLCQDNLLTHIRLNPNATYRQINVSGNRLANYSSVSGKNIEWNEVNYIFGQQNTSSTGVFTDVPSDAFYANAVKWAVENEITTGVGNNRFDPNGQCTRGQVVTFLWRAAGKPTVSTNVSFTDVQPGAFYYEAVKWAVANGITQGVGGNRFAPNDSCTRGQVVTFLHRAANSPSVSSVSSFTDVPMTAFYYNAVNWAVANGITNGTGNGRFSPNDTCTRAQVVTFLYRAQ